MGVDLGGDRGVSVAGDAGNVDQLAALGQERRDEGVAQAVESHQRARRGPLVAALAGCVGRGRRLVDQASVVHRAGVGLGGRVRMHLTVVLATPDVAVGGVALDSGGLFTPCAQTRDEVPIDRHVA